MTKIFCNTHQAEFLELNPEVPENFFMLSMREKTVPVLEKALYPQIGGCKACMALPANAGGFDDSYVDLDEVRVPPPHAKNPAE